MNLRSSLPILAICVAALPTWAGAANAAANSVVSSSIKPADGTTGQVVTTGSGVKTGHIQDAAITTSKITNGAVTDAKITGPISAEKIQRAGLDADTVDGQHAAAFAAAAHSHSASYQRRYAKVVVVSADGDADFTDPRSAVASVVAATEQNRYLVKVLPGVYNIGMDPIEMKPYVDLEGSGVNVTKIVASSDGSARGGVLVFRSTVPSEARDLTMEISSTGVYLQTHAVDGAVVTTMDASAHLTNVRLVSLNAINGVGLFSTGSGRHLGDTILTNVVIEVSETLDVAALTGVSTSRLGVWAHGDNSLEIRGSRVSARGGSLSIGVFLEGYEGLRVQDSTITADQYALQAGTFDPGGYQPFDPVKVYRTTLTAPTCAIRVNSIGQPPGFFGNSLELGGPLCVLPGTRIRLSQSFDATFAPLPDVLQ